MQLDPSVFAHLMTPAVIALNSAVANAGFTIRIVGGAVRDLVQGLDPKDIDMATDATPEQMMALLDEVGIRHEPTGLQHGTITAIIDGEPIEITTLRIDSDQDGRHATVEFTNDWRLDAERRDLTFNAMSMEMDGTLHDYFGGAADLQNGVAKFVGDADARITEDFLRIMRFFRFQGRIANPVWDTDTMDAVRRNVDGLTQVSGERIWMELEKILQHPNRLVVLRKMDEAGVLDVIGLPTVDETKVGVVTDNDPSVVLSTLVDNIQTLDAVRKKWKFDNVTSSNVAFILSNRNNPQDEHSVMKLLTNPKVNDRLVFALLAAQGENELLERVKNTAVPVFPVTGADLLEAGVKQGKAMGDALTQMRVEWEDSNFTMAKEQLMMKV